MVRKDGLVTIGRCPLNDNDGRQTNVGGPLGVKRLGDACRTGGGVVRDRLRVLGGDGWSVW